MKKKMMLKFLRMMVKKTIEVNKLKNLRYIFIQGLLDFVSKKLEGHVLLIIICFYYIYYRKVNINF